LVRFFVRRLLNALLVVFGALVAVFVIARLSGDPVRLMISPDATEEQVQAMREGLGLDAPIYMQFLSFLGGVVRGDLGRSLWQEQPVMTLVLERLPATAQLTLAAMTLALVIALPLGTLAAVKRDSIADRLAMFFAVIGQAMPNFWLGILLIQVFAVALPILPSSGSGTWKHLILPAVTLGLFSTARTTRLVRSGLLDILGEDYIRTARAKGVGDLPVLVRHALRNAMLPVITLVALEFGRLLGGAVVTETIFAWPGLGRLAVESIARRDFPLLQGIVIVVAIGFVVVNLIVDLLYAVLDPRIRHE
jgi:peptide/nickel transport system permease protein